MRRGKENRHIWRSAVWNKCTAFTETNYREQALRRRHPLWDIAVKHIFCWLFVIVFAMYTSSSLSLFSGRDDGTFTILKIFSNCIASKPPGCGLNSLYARSFKPRSMFLGHIDAWSMFKKLQKQPMSSKTWWLSDLNYFQHQHNHQHPSNMLERDYFQVSLHPKARPRFHQPISFYSILYLCRISSKFISLLEKTPCALLPAKQQLNLGCRFYSCFYFSACS